MTDDRPRASPRRATPRRTRRTRQAPRYTGIRTFARCPHVPRRPTAWTSPSWASPSTRPRATAPARASAPRRSAPASALLRPWHPRTSVDVFAVAVGGGLRATSRSRPATPLARWSRSRTASARCCAAGVTPIVLGGDHSIAARRAARARRRRTGRGRARPPRRARRHLGRVLRRAHLPRHAVPARGRGGRARRRRGRCSPACAARCTGRVDVETAA